MNRGEKIWTAWGLGFCGIMAVAEVVEGKTTAALALAGAYSVLCLAAWLLT